VNNLKNILPSFIIFLLIFILNSCSPQTDEKRANVQIPPIIKNASKVFGISFRLPCHNTQLKEVLLDPATGKIAYKTSYYSDKGSISLRLLKKSVILSSAKGKIVFLENMEGSSKRYIIEIAHTSNVRTRYSGVYKPVIKEGQIVKSRIKLGVAKTIFDFAILVTSNSLDPRIINSYYKRVFKSPEWISVFPLLLIFGEGVFDVKQYQ